MIPGPQIDIISFDGVTGIVEVDITIDNPSALNAYDVRLIIFTDSVGHMLMDPNDWTNLYDQAGGLPVNPFRAYATGETNRLFTGQSQHTERLKVYLPAGNPNVKFAIDASFPGNCLEPYTIDGFNQEFHLHPDFGSSTLLEVFVEDWQNDANAVYLYCPAILGAPLLTFTQDPLDLELWEATITNNTGASAGYHPGFIVAYSSNSGSQALYDRAEISVVNPPPTYDSEGIIGGTNNEYPYDTAVTEIDGFYIAGDFFGQCDFNPQSGIYWLTTSEDYSDAFLARYYDYGGLNWARSWGSYDDDDTAWGVCSDQTGYAYVVGYWKGTVDFDPGTGIVQYTSKGMSDCFVSKFSPSGNLIWAKVWGGDNTDRCRGCAIDTSGNIYLIGEFSATADFDPGSSVVQYTSNGGWDCFLSKLDSSGNFVYAKTWGGTNNDYPCSVAIDGSGNVILTGNFESTVDFDPTGSIDNHYSNGVRDIFLCKYASDGTYIWTRTWGGSGDEWVSELALDNDGDIFVHGVFQETVDFDPGTGQDLHSSKGWDDVFLSKITNNGNHSWTHTWGSSGWMDWGYGVTIDPSGNVLVVGSFTNVVDFDPGPETDWRYATGGEYDEDPYMVGYSSDGLYLWAITWEGSSDDWLKQVICPDEDTIIAIGNFEESLDFDPGPSSNVYFASGEYDIFFEKLIF